MELNDVYMKNEVSTMHGIFVLQSVTVITDSCSLDRKKKALSTHWDICVRDNNTALFINSNLMNKNAQPSIVNFAKLELICFNITLDSNIKI